MTVRWGILGAARFAEKHMAPAIHAAKGASLDALATSSPDKAERFRAFCPGLRVHDSYEALLDDPEIDAVYIPLPNTLHVGWSLKALAAGKHVLCEKPIAMQAPEIDALIAARDQSGLLAAEAYMIVHHPQWQRTRALIADGAIGQVVHVEGLFGFDISADPGNIRNRPETGGGAIPDIGVYTYGSTRFATGAEPEDITQAALVFDRGVDVMAQVSAKFPGFTAHWVNSTRMFPAQMMTFVGSEGLIRLTAPFNAGVFGEARVEVHQPGLAIREERFPGVNQYVLQVEAFCRSVDGGEPYAWPLEEARATQRMIDRIYTKAQGGVSASSIRMMC